MSNSKVELNEEQLIELHKFYEDKGFRDKKQMMTLFTLMVPIVFGLIAFCWTGISDENMSSGWLDIYQFSSTPQSCGRGRQDWISLTMRRSPRVNQEVLLRATFLG
jgi:hypothetical protein